MNFQPRSGATVVGGGCILPRGGGGPTRVVTSQSRIGATVVGELAAVAGELPVPAAVTPQVFN
jgi:hypothetical protein